MEFIRKTWRIEVKEQPNGLMHINTNSYEIKDASFEDFKYAVMPFIDLKESIQIIAEDHLKPIFIQMFLSKIPTRCSSRANHITIYNFIPKFGASSMT